MASLSFREDAVASVVDKWLDLEEVEQNEPDFHGTALSATSNQRGGLGFQGKRPDNEKMGSVLRKDNKRKIANKADEYLTEMHGIVDDLEESRTQLVLKPKSAESRKGTEMTAKKKAAQAPKKGEEKQVAGKGGHAPTEERKAASGAESLSAPAPPSKKPKLAAPQEPHSSSASIDSNSLTSSATSPAKKKPNRVKTRSKQKNIRRDHRPEGAKPQHLQLGSKDYAGRGLTEQTKVLLNVPAWKKQKNPKGHAMKQSN